ncbi:MAG: aspartyl protease family protein [Candidatus Eisenbacteria bacterium]|nr:aspartyl protease family protein [Candidatus Eisenbacteria bacterium]
MRAVVFALALAVLAPVARGDWLQPDPSYRDAQFLLRQAQRDTLDHGNDPVRLDSLGVALLRLGRTADAATIFGRTLAVRPNDPAALAAIGKLALFAGRLAEAESLLTLAGPDPAALADLYAARLRRGEWARAAELAPQVNEAGRVPMLTWLAEHPPFRITGPDVARVQWNKSYPIPLLRVKLNGQSVLMGLDTGARDLILDQSFARRCNVTIMPTQVPVFWEGTRIAVQNAVVQRLELGGLRIEDVPAGVAGLRSWSNTVNPQDEPVAGVIGLALLQRFTPTIDYRDRVLILRKAGTPALATARAQRVPFEIWGESELTVRGSIAGGRTMAMVVGTGLAGCGVGAPEAVFSEVGVKPGALSRAIKGAGSWLQGRPWASLTVPTVTVGPLVRDRVTGWSGALDDAELWRHGVRRDAILSHDFFKNQRLTFDWDHRELIVENE